MTDFDDSIANAGFQSRNQEDFPESEKQNLLLSVSVFEQKSSKNKHPLNAKRDAGSQRLKNLIVNENDLPDWINEKSLALFLDINGQIRAVYGNAIERLGFAKKDLLGKSCFSSLFSAHRARQFRQTFNALVAGQENNINFFALPLRTKSGQELEFMWQLFSLSHDQQNSFLFFGVDIANQTQHIEYLRYLDARIDAVEHQSQIGSVAWDNQNQRLRISNQLYRMCGLEPGKTNELLESLIRHILDSTDGDSAAPIFSSNSAPTNLKNITLHADNDSEREFHGERFPILDDNGNLKYLIGTASDATNKRNLESSLRKAQQLLLGSEKLAHVGGWEWNVIEENLTWSPELYRIYGLDPATCIPITIDKAYSYTHPDDKDSVLHHINRAMDDRVSVPFTFRIVRPDGSTRYLLSNCEAEVDESQNVSRLIGFAQDITERALSEQAQVDGNKKFEALFNQSIFGVAVINSGTGQFLEVNQKFCDMLGYRENELKNFNLLDITHPQDRENEAKFLSTFTPGKIQDKQLEKRYIKKDGSTLWVLLSVLSCDDEKLNWHISIIDDISQRKKAEQTLSLQRIEQQLILNSISDSILVLDHDLEIITYNKSTESIFSYEGTRLNKKSLRQLIPDSIANNIGFYQAIDASLRNIHTDTMLDAIGMKSQGERFPIRITISQLPQNMFSHSRLLVSCHDLSKEKLQEEQLRRTQKMDALGKLTGGIAHDYNNMLGIIVGYSKLLHDALEHNPKLSSYIDEIQKATTRGTRLSRKLLAFSKNILPETDILELNALLTTERDLLQKTLTPRISLEYSLGENLWSICVNAGDLEDALLNLCINATQAIEFTGGIKISTENVSLTKADLVDLSLITEGDYVSIRVEDTGVGIDPKYIDNIFDPFFTTKGQHGVGLGLSMVYGFVKRSHGDIKVISTPGQGSVFTLYFPRYQDALPQRESRIAKQDQNQQYSGVEKILIVDDEPSMVTLCSEILTAQGYQCECAISAEQALDTINFRSIDLLISDVIMPGMDGYQLIAAAQAINPSLKVLLVSGYTPHRQDRHSDYSSIRLLQKPFSSDELLTQVRAVLNAELTNERKLTRRVLVMDDDENIRTLYELNLNRLGYEVIQAETGEETIRLYTQAMQKVEPIDIVILDLSIPGSMGGVETASALLKIDANACLVVSSGDSYGDVMTNYKDYGFKAVLEKTFDRVKLKKTLDALPSQNPEHISHTLPA